MIYQIDPFYVHLDLKHNLFLLALLLQLEWPKIEDSNGLMSSLERLEWEVEIAQATLGGMSLEA